jgi:hypothetical protein
MVAAMKEPPTRETQGLIDDPAVPQRDAELEEAGVRWLNAVNEKKAAEDKRKAAYAEVKEIMRRKRVDEYKMTDANKTLYARTPDIEIVMKDTPTGTPDED